MKIQSQLADKTEAANPPPQRQPDAEDEKPLAHAPEPTATPSAEPGSDSSKSRLGPAAPDAEPTKKDGESSRSELKEKADVPSHKDSPKAAPGDGKKNDDSDGGKGGGDSVEVVKGGDSHAKKDSGDKEKADAPSPEGKSKTYKEINKDTD